MDELGRIARWLIGELQKIFPRLNPGRDDGSDPSELPARPRSQGGRASRRQCKQEGEKGGENT